MVESISPAYYASGGNPSPFTLTGENLDQIPADAIGLRSGNNDDPLQHRYDETPVQIYDLEVSENTIVATIRSNTQVGVRVYFSAIVSADRSTIYWVNNTKPLP